MKKFSLLVALALCITIGGVYATWNYAQGVVPATSKEVTVNMDTIVNAGAPGTLDLNASGVRILVDQDPNTTDHGATFAITGDAAVTFTPQKDADKPVKDYGINATYSITCSNPDLEYNGIKIFTVDTSAKALSFAKQLDGSFTATISADDISNLISINSAIKLPNQTEYTNFQNTIKGVVFLITITPGAVAIP